MGPSGRGGAVRGMPILVGDKFRLKTSGDIWEIVEDKHFGNVETFCKDKVRFCSRTKEQLRNSELWERVA